MIPPEIIAAVKDRTDIVAVIRESVPSLKRRGRSFVGLCPFHQEKTGSFHVNPDRGFFHCFGCKESGSVVDFLMKHDGYTFPEAVRALAERAGIVVEETRVDAAERDAQARAKKQKDDLYAVNQAAAVYFEQQLREHPQRQYALDELARRGLVPREGEGATGPIEDALQAFRIGYAPSGWDGLANYLRANGISPYAAEQVGLLVPRSSGSGYYDRFRHRLMFAVVDPQGRVVAFSGRALQDLPGEAPPKDPPPKYINSPESPIYTKGNALFGLYQARHAIRAEDRVVLVEGNFDVVSLHARGVQNVVAPLGTAFTLDQAKLLMRFTRNVTLLFDGDAAGQKATRMARDVVREAGLDTRVAVLPAGKDPDDLVREQGTEALEGVLKQAKGMTEYLFHRMLDESFSSANAYEQSARIQYVVKLLTEETDPIVRALHKAYVDQLAGRLDIVRAGEEAFRALEAQVKKALAEAGPRPMRHRGVDPRFARIESRPAGIVQQESMIGVLIEYPELLDDAEVQGLLGALDGVYARAAVGIAKARNLAGEMPHSEKSPDGSVFLAQIPEAIHPFAFERLAAPQHENLDLARAAFVECARNLERLNHERETRAIAREQAKVVADEVLSDELLREALERTRKARGVK